MVFKLFIIGLPGSGKSSVARYIAKYIGKIGWETIRINDYVILKEMFMADIEHKQFKPTDHGGFDVLDVTAGDKALNQLKSNVNLHLLSAKRLEIILIEFARNDYRRAFRQFSAEFLYDAYFLYLNTDLKICKKRISERIINPDTDDDFYVSEDIFNSYYNKDDGRSIPQILASDRGIDEQRVKIIDNNGSLSDFIAQVNRFVDTMCGLGPLQNS